MKYELAKQLKDAGFPQEIKEGRVWSYFENGRGPWRGSHWEANRPNESHGSDWIYSPTLSELIEVCGEQLLVMKKGTYFGEKGWLVGQDSLENLNDSTSWEVKAFGSTLIEAVAKLWLELNKK